MNRAALLATAGLLLAAPLARGAAAPVLSPPARQHVIEALRHLNMDASDPGFEKDVAEPRLVLERVRRLLAQPLQLPELADECLAAVAASNTLACLDGAVHWLELDDDTPPQSGPSAATASAPMQAAGADWMSVVERFRRSAERAEHELHTAFEGLDRAARHALAADLLTGVFLAEDRTPVRRALVAQGITPRAITHAVDDARHLDPAPAANAHLDRIDAIDMALLLRAARRLQHALDALCRDARTVTRWPTAPQSVDTDIGTLRVGTTGNDTHDRAACLILDPAGNDRYTDAAGSAFGAERPAIAVVCDLAGNDCYDSEAVLGPGAALFGIALLHDAAGNDVYRVAYTGLGAGLFGVAVLEDDDGDDLYQGHALAQGAGYAGVGILRDRAGIDRYDIGFDGQAYAGVGAIGLLIDDRGNDRYTAGSRRPDYDRHAHRYLSTSQGFAIGLRPFAGGGMAALVDREGNDVYIADVFGQGASYWYAVGMLLDEDGHDTYHLYEYGQGSAVHLSLGLLADRSGADTYTGFSLSQGSAHDYAVGILLDHDGNDTYTADHYAQGLAINNAFALLLDAAGNDAYFADQTGRSQGIGNDGHEREYGALALLLDLAGTDRYSCTALNAARTVRPNHGIIYDVAP